jgi:site-specific DNA recombinase
LLRTLALDQEVADWVVTALKESHGDERRLHDEAVSRLQGELQKLSNRLETLYEDKLDGRIDIAFYDRKSREWRAEQSRLHQLIDDHQKAEHSYMDEGVRILELAQKAGALFDRQGDSEKRKLLNCVMERAVWKGATLTVEFRQPFDMLLDAASVAEAKQSVPLNSRTRKTSPSNSANGRKQEPNGDSTGRFENWLPGMDSNHDSRLQRPLSYH